MLIVTVTQSAMELKTSWIDASEVTDQSRYVLSQAVVSVFDHSKENGHWTVSGTEEKILPLVGIHIVGSVNKHPEMV